MNSQFMLTLLLVCVISIITMPEGIAKINPENIVGIWLLDEEKGETVGDATESGHDGIITGPPQWGEGKFGNALDVGASSYVRVPHSEDLSLKTFTITTWLSTQVGGAWIGVISKAHDNPTRNYTLYLHQDTNTASISIGNQAAGAWSDTTGKTAVNDGKWHHVAISFDEKTKVGRVFTDGVQESQYTVAHEIPQHEADLVFASWAHGGGNGGYIGLLDDIAIFNVALEEADVKDIMQNGLGELGSPIEPKGKLAARWAKIKSSAVYEIKSTSELR